MPRVKSGTVTRRRHSKVLRTTKGHLGTRHTLFRRAHESMLHAMDYSYGHRRERKGDFRRLWITRLNAAARANGLTYSQLMDQFSKLGIDINRKVLSQIAIEDPQAFTRLIGLSSPK